MTELERELVDLAANLDYPPTPDLAHNLRRRLEARPGRRLITRRRLVLAFALLLVAVGAALVVPPARTAILEWLGLKGAAVEHVVTLPEIPASGDLALGERVALDEARRRVEFAIVVPELLGPPDEVYVADDVPGGRASLVWGPDEELERSPHTGVGLLLVEFSGELDPALIEKLTGPGTPVEPVALGGAPGLWIEGEPHVVLYHDAQGEVREDTLRLAGNALLWERGDLLLRLEADLSKAQALEIARSMG
jgi:hypothetical protein